MDAADIVGTIAGTLATISFIPQVIRTFRLKQAKDISLFMYSIFCLGVLMWTVYGILKGEPPLIAANAVTLALAISILIMKIRYG